MHVVVATSVARVSENFLLFNSSSGRVEERHAFKAGVVALTREGLPQKEKDGKPKVAAFELVALSWDMKPRIWNAPLGQISLDM